MTNSTLETTSDFLVICDVILLGKDEQNRTIETFEAEGKNFVQIIDSQDNILATFSGEVAEQFCYYALLTDCLAKFIDRWLSFETKFVYSFA